MGVLPAWASKLNAGRDREQGGGVPRGPGVLGRSSAAGAMSSARSDDTGLGET